MILEEKVLVRITPKNVAYWQAKGYKNAEMCRSILVKTKHLAPDSLVYVAHQCDSCQVKAKSRYCHIQGTCAPCRRKEALAANQPKASLPAKTAAERLKTIQAAYKESFLDALRINDADWIKELADDLSAITSAICHLEASSC